MAELAPSGSSLGLFLTAALILALTPGPGVFYIVASALAGGTRAGLLSVLGIALGTLVHIVFAVVGLTALIASMPQAFAILKYTGAVYLIFLGVRVIWGISAPDGSSGRPVPTRSLAIVRRAIIINVLNPKVGIFFLAFLPQFVDPARGSVAAQFIALGLTLVILASFTDTLYAMFSSKVSRWLSENVRNQKWPGRVAGSTYMALGVASALLQAPLA
ncbi:MAG: LysE family translocator [Arenicellales bacterium]|nr:LysE family translocator [Gammaproteobacteria bacterium]NDG44807.1 LysE family translocator [Gammaproteobacteria bacterium]